MCNQHEKSGFMAFAKSKCPRCRSGKFFTNPFYSLGNFLKFHPICPVCGLKFEKETGFFWSAMYIPVVVAMAAKQNVIAAISGGPVAILAGFCAVVLSFIMIPLISKLNRNLIG